MYLRIWGEFWSQNWDIYSTPEVFSVLAKLRARDRVWMEWMAICCLPLVTMSIMATIVTMYKVYRIYIYRTYREYIYIINAVVAHPSWHFPNCFIFITCAYVSIAAELQLLSQNQPRLGQPIQTWAFNRCQKRSCEGRLVRRVVVRRRYK